MTVSALFEKEERELLLLLLSPDNQVKLWRCFWFLLLPVYALGLIVINENKTYRSLSSLQVSKAVGPADYTPKRLFKNFAPPQVGSYNPGYL